MFDAQRFIAQRALDVDASGIRRVFDLAADLKDPINLSIGQPHFDVPQPIKEAAIDAIRAGRNQYTQTQGTADLRGAIHDRLARELPHWKHAATNAPEPYESLISSGVSGGLLLAMLACVGPGDEVLIPDPYFVMYRHLVTLSGATPVYVDTYPDFQLSVDRLELQVTERTKMLLFNSPSNPTGVVATNALCRQIADFCDQKNILLLSDEIYDEFCYEKTPRPQGTCGHGEPMCPSPAAFSTNLLLMRGFSKSYGMTGWRLGYVAGPRPIVEQMTKLQQYTFVCAPSMAQAGGVAALDVDMSAEVAAYAKKRDMVVEQLADRFEVTTPGGAFYAFVKVPDHLGQTGSAFVERAIEKGVLIIPGHVFSNRDTHFRISYACDEPMLGRGLGVLNALAE